MKRTILVVALAFGFVLNGGIVEETKSKPVFAGAVKFAPFQDLLHKAGDLGLAINNPIMPTLLMGSCQQQLVKAFGRFRNDDPIYIFNYAMCPAWEIVAKDSNKGNADDVVSMAVIYPSVNQAAKMILNHPGAKRDADGVIKLLPAEGRPNDTYVFYTKDGRYCAFADSAAVAKKAIADFHEVTAQGNWFEKKVIAEAYVNKLGFSTMLLLGKTDDANLLTMLEAEGKASEELAEISKHEKAFRQEFIKEYDGFRVSIDFNKLGLNFSGTIFPSKEAKVCDCKGMGLPKMAFEKIPAGTSFYFAGYEGILKKANQQSAGMKEIFLQYVKMFTTEKYVKFFEELDSSFKALPKLNDKDWKSVRLAFNDKFEPYVDMVVSKDGALSENCVAGKKFKPAATKETKTGGASEYFEALPEAKKNAPSSVFFMRPYAFVKDVIFPASFVTKNAKQIEEYKSLMKSMPPVEENSALACAGWLDKDGKYRVLMRLTIGEIKNYGAAFNAFMEASLMNQVEQKQDSNKETK